MAGTITHAYFVLDLYDKLSISHVYKIKIGGVFNHGKMRNL